MQIDETCLQFGIVCSLRNANSAESCQCSQSNQWLGEQIGPLCYRQTDRQTEASERAESILSINKPLLSDHYERASQLATRGQVWQSRNMNLMQKLLPVKAKLKFNTLHCTGGRSMPAVAGSPECVC